MDYHEINKSTFNALAKEYEEKSFIRQAFNRIIIQNLFPYIESGGKVLDIGCGVGLDIELMRESGLEPSGIDFSHEMVIRARQRNPSTRIVEGNFLEFEFVELFDGIFCQSFIHLFPAKDTQRVFDRIYALLKVNGIVYFTITHSNTNKEAFMTKADYAGNHTRFKKLWTIDVFMKLLHDNRFSVVSTQKYRDPFNKEFHAIIARKF